MSADLPEGIRVQKAGAEIALQERVVLIIANSLGAPIWYHSGKQHVGFRFLKPTWKHFCLLKSVRAVSGLNACLKLFDAGFSQEIAVLIRTVVECTTHMDFVIAGLAGDNLAAPQQKYVDAYFADFKRDQVADFRKPRVPQAEVHKAVGAQTDERVRQVDQSGRFADVDSARLMSNVYLVYSNYVHSRYPEVMDLFGGDPGRFHICGMRGTPKDLENIAIIEAFVVTVSNALRFFVLHMGLGDKIMNDPELAIWLPVSGPYG